MNNLDPFSTIVLGATCVYIATFFVIVVPIVFIRWATGQSPRFIPQPWPTKQTSSSSEPDVSPPP